MPSVLRLPPFDQEETLFLSRCSCLSALKLQHSTFSTLRSHPQLGLTCLLSAPSGGQGAGPVARSVEGRHADHVGGVARQVLQLHPELRQEQRPQALRLVSELIFPEIDLERQITRASDWDDVRLTFQKTGLIIDTL